MTASLLMNKIVQRDAGLYNGFMPGSGKTPKHSYCYHPRIASGKRGFFVTIRPPELKIQNKRSILTVNPARNLWDTAQSAILAQKVNRTYNILWLLDFIPNDETRAGVFDRARQINSVDEEGSAVPVYDTKSGTAAIPRTSLRFDRGRLVADYESCLPSQLPQLSDDRPERRNGCAPGEPTARGPNPIPKAHFVRWKAQRLGAQEIHAHQEERHQEANQYPPQDPIPLPFSPVFQSVHLFSWLNLGLWGNKQQGENATLNASGAKEQT